MEYDKGYNNRENVYSKKIRAGRKRTYFIDVKKTRSEDFFITITESKRKFDTNQFIRHKVHLYKEDFNKFILGLEDVIDYVKTELMPEYDFDTFNHEYPMDGAADDSQKNVIDDDAEGW